MSLVRKSGFDRAGEGSQSGNSIGSLMPNAIPGDRARGGGGAAEGKALL